MAKLSGFESKKVKFSNFEKISRSCERSQKVMFSRHYATLIAIVYKITSIAEIAKTV